jgi:hypothetical protein
MFEIQLLGMSEALGFAVGTGCVGYMSAGIVATFFFILPVLFLSYIIRRGVSSRAVYMPSEGTCYSRWCDHWREHHEAMKKWYLCIPYGFFIVLYEAFHSAMMRGRWEPIQAEEEEEKDKVVQPFWRHPLSAFQKRFGPMFEDFTDVGW